jgi:hypothetical protein
MWQLNAALLSRPADLSALVRMSMSDPLQFFTGDGILGKMVQRLLNNESRNSDKMTKIDVLTILGNLAKKAAVPGQDARDELAGVLSSVSGWFDDYMHQEESDGQTGEPELHKCMLILIARIYDYELKSEDLLELTGGDRYLALATIVGLLEDGETYSTGIQVKSKAGEQQRAQWEHALVYHRYEKSLVVQISRLLRGFTHPNTFFSGSDGDDVSLHMVEEFSVEMDSLLELTMTTNLVEKITIAMHEALFVDDEDEEDEDDEDSLAQASSTKPFLEESDHIAVTCIHQFLQNLYFYGTGSSEAYRQHLLADTMLVPRLVLPYLERCVMHAEVLCQRADAYRYVV